MLKRLELIGFKSFADKTTFEFSPGLTAVVGPNGSGKSNIVDAVKWVLGEQSAKSLRGGEMADVIFNGSSVRRSLGMAEVTMTFDNSRKLLAVDAEEVQITRRVYRDGQGEYLINQLPSRLRDIKDLFLGSGAGHGAYSIIEQGRVDALLQASHKDRRIIFEEAAGISRFKARKIETLRKLEHVEQNLARSKDILAEVDKQLRSVKLQAAKAQRYQEYSNRLRELRIALGLREYTELEGQLQGEETTLTGLRQRLELAANQSAAGEKSMHDLDAALAGVEERLHAAESRLADARQLAAAQETTRAFETTALADLDTSLDQLRRRRMDLMQRRSTSAVSADQARVEWLAAAALADVRRRDLANLETRLRECEDELARLRQQIENDRAEHLERMRQAARFQNDATGLAARLDNLRQRRDGLRIRTDLAAEHLANLESELLNLSQAEADMQRLLDDARRQLGICEEEREQLRHEADEAQQRLAELRVERTALSSRVELLEQLERSREGLGDGVREVLDLVAQSRQRGAEEIGDDWSFVLGLVADQLSVPHELAPLIDLALGERAQYFVVSDAAVLDRALQNRGKPLSGRVGFLPLKPADMPALPLVGDPAELSQRADVLVGCENQQLAQLPAQLLGTTRIVPDLATARTLASIPENAGLRFVTRNGELLESDGTLTVGRHHADAGILSRKSELRELRQQATELEYQRAAVEQELHELRLRSEALDQPIYELQQRIAMLVDEARDVDIRVSLQRGKRSDLHDEVELSRNEIVALEQEIHGLERTVAEAHDRAEATEKAAQEVQARAEQAEREARDREQDRLQREQDCSQARVDLARVEEQLARQRERLLQMENDVSRAGQEVQELDADEMQLLSRHRESQLALLQASGVLAECCLTKEAAEAEIVTLDQDRDRIRSERRNLAEQLQIVINERQDLLNQAHACEMRAIQLRGRRDGITERLREDYQVELADLVARPEDGSRKPEPEEPLDPAAAQTEIEELKRKLTRLGAVNLEALQELTELERRSVELDAQHRDLLTSQGHLLEIIGRINQDSKQLFTEAFASIRTHFQDLFRRLFGGGMADIILEDENDILECGIEINARPPGKELRSISLMSGGERTLTAIALLMAIFRSKPSPFCLLDEVDAALDEANNTRLAAVLREFLAVSQFIVVTHKKRTMAVADALYGITMQESGVSKQISVRFEDWPDEKTQEQRAAAG